MPVTQESRASAAIILSLSACTHNLSKPQPYPDPQDLDIFILDKQIQSAVVICLIRTFY